MANSTHTIYTQVTLPTGHRTYVPVRLPSRTTNPKHVAVTASTIGVNPRFKRNG